MDKYSTHIYWSNDDNEYVAIATEFPGLSGIGKTKAKAVKFLEDAIEMALEFYKEDKENAPEPVLLPEYSGNIRLRIPKSLHKTLSEKAEIEGTSLNQYMVYLLSSNFYQHDKVITTSSTTINQTHINNPNFILAIPKMTPMENAYARTS